MTPNNDTLRPPIAKKIPHRMEMHGDVRVDDYFWIREKTNPEVTALLNAENAYKEAMLAPESKLRESLFEELKSRIKEDDSNVPYKMDDYYYYTRVVPGQQYGIHCRKHGSLDAAEEVILDENVLSEGKTYFHLGVLEVSPDHRWLAYSVDLDGAEKYTIYVKDLHTGHLSAETIANTSTSLEWAEDSATFYYTMLDANERPDRLLKHTHGEDPKNDVLIYQETNPELFVYCSKSRSRRYIFLEIQGKVTSEVHYVDARHPQNVFQVIEPRRPGVLYSVTHHEDSFFIVTNDTVQNFRLVQTPVTDPGSANWQEVRSGSPTLFIQDAEAFRSYLVVHERENGLQQIRIVDLKANTDHLIAMPEPTYALGGEANAEFDTEIFRFSYTSLVTPNTVFDYNMRTRQLDVKKRQEIPSGYDAKLYRSERVFATAPDGAKVPVSIVYKLDSNGDFKKDGSRPLYLYGYGSYGISMRPTFSTTRLSLLDRGFVFAIAHIRGGSEMGRAWYEDAKFLKKKNTFIDFVTSAEHLIKEGFTRKGEIVIAGGSAGGLLVGATLNMKPELFKAAVAHVPFVDALNTMLDETLPLTTFEYEEWGNPNDKAYYDYIKSYSPYDNIRATAYPHLLVTSGLNDPRVTYWEPAKWVARLREMKTDENLLLQHINMEAGHGGASGRYDSLKEVALEYAFILKAFRMSQG